MELGELVAVSLWLSEELILGVSETLGVWLKLAEEVRLGVTLLLPEILAEPEAESVTLGEGEKLVLGVSDELAVSPKTVLTLLIAP